MTLELLPTELLQLILNHLSDFQLLRISQVSKNFKMISERDYFWHDRYDNYFEEDVRPDLLHNGWKTIYFQYKRSRMIPVSIIPNEYIASIRLFPTDKYLQLFDILHKLTSISPISCIIDNVDENIVIVLEEFLYINTVIREKIYHNHSLVYNKLLSSEMLHYFPTIQKIKVFGS